MAKDTSKFLEAEARVWEHYGVTPVDRRVTLASGGELRVQEVGEGVPFVLIHGGSVAGTSWSHLAAHLEGVKCILVDRPGCGLSDPIMGGPMRELHELESYADGLLADILDALELEQAAVGATSFGGYYAFRGASAAPHRVTKMVEYSWPVGAPSAAAPLTVRLAALPGAQAMTNFMMSKMPLPRSMIVTALKQFGLGKIIESGAFSDLMIDWVYALFNHTDTPANEGRAMPKLFFPIKGQNVEVQFTDELLSKLTMPTLFLWGDEDPNGGGEVARSFVPRLPNGELVLIPGGEHVPWLDDPDTCVTRTQEFLLN